MGNIIFVKCRKLLKPVAADAGDCEYAYGDSVMVETESGPMLGSVVHWMSCQGESCSQAACPKVLGMATEEDIRQEDLNVRMERDYREVCEKKINKYSLPMKLVDVEIASDGSKVVFFFVAEDRVDFRQLVRELASDLRTRIEMRQIGARSEAQRVGGIGCCGRELCCTTFLKKFVPVTVRMAKEQDLPLDPEKISGVCGRLMCCLVYEHDNYVKAKRGLPKIGKKIKLPQGTGKVRQINILSKKMSVELEDGMMVDMSIDDYLPEKQQAKG